MKIANQHKNVSLKGTLAVKEATIKSDGGHVMRMLANMYSNPTDAIVREYITNMHDAYKALKRKDANAVIRPAEITVPSKLSSELVFRDFGIGMDFDTAWNTFTSFGFSTKNDNDDETGAFGLGCKSAFAYNSGTPWMIESIFDGQKHTIMAFVNDKNVPSFAHVSTVDTTEHSGVMIRIPILAADYAQVLESVKNYARYFPLPLTVSGTNITPLTYTESKDGEWGMGRDDDRELRIVMGNVPYTFQTDHLYDLSYHNFMLNNGIDLYMPIGSVEVVPSRDDLMYTTKTLNAICAAADQMVADFKALFNSRLDACDSEWNALVACSDITHIQYLDNVMGKELAWRGKLISHVDGVVRKSTELMALDPNIAYDRIGITATHSSTLDSIDFNVTGIEHSLYVRPKAKTWIVRNDMEKEKGLRYLKRFLRAELVNRDGYTGNARKYGHTIGHAIYVKTDLTNAELSAFFGGYPDVDIKLVSDLAALFPNASYGSGEVRKYKGSVYTYFTNRQTRYGTGGWNAGVAVPVDANGLPTKEYYLPLTQNDKTSRFGYSHNVDRLFEVAREVGLTFPNGLYGVKESEVAKFDALGWTNFHTELENRVVMIATTRIKELMTLVEVPNKTHNNTFVCVMTDIELESLGHPAVVKYLATTEDIIVKDDMRAVHDYFYDFKLSSQTSLDNINTMIGNVVPLDLDDLREEIFTAYPIVRFLVDARNYARSAIENHKDLLLDFCKTTV